MPQEQNLTIDNLKRISVSVEFGTSPDRMEQARQPEKFDFIFGIGSRGITPFEYELANRKKGAVVTIHVQSETAPAYFAHLGCAMLPLIGKEDETDIKVTVLDVALPDNREIIAAMAHRAECGEGCECGCGC